MNLPSGLSAFKTLLLVVLYFIMTGIFSIKTLYYYPYNNLFWWLYFVAMTLAFVFWIHHSIFGKKYRFLVMLAIAFFIGYMPFEILIVTSMELIANPTAELSGLASKLPVPFGILADILFYPLVLLVPLWLVSVVTGSIK